MPTAYPGPRLIKPPTGYWRSMLNDDDIETAAQSDPFDGPADGGANPDAHDGGADGSADDGGKLRSVLGTGSLTSGSVTGGSPPSGGHGTGAGDMSGTSFTGTGDVTSGGDDGVDRTGAGPVNDDSDA
jgi:hypothetical protein